ncbi:MAG: pilus (MSHA type) biogenesis protein MshL [Betaproteobacteria bacterium]|nr:pilus (MSHA type) biogenesis protein MshL [Betaproteobacteria bacterium]
MKRILAIALGAIVLAGCAATPAMRSGAPEAVSVELAKAAQERPKAAQPDTVSGALLPPLKVEMPKAGDRPLDPKFDLVVNNAPAAQVFMGIVSGTRYSMLVHPDITGTISVNLKDVTVLEALETIRELYGYEYKMDGPRIFIQPISLQTRVFQVNYLTGQRQGKSEVRVNASTGIPVGGTAGAPAPAAAGGTGTVQSSNITTTSNTDFWNELKASLDAIVGQGQGRNVVVSPQTGVIVVRAMPEELRNVAAYLKASQLAVERQVILEAKILEVELKDGYQQGINWAAFRTGGNSRLSIGLGDQGSVLQNSGPLASGVTTIDATTRTFTAPQLLSDPGANLITAATAVGGLFGLAFQTSNFAALLSFLETQGTVHVLSSPRIATLNNQKAVLKVGQDELFVTNVTGGTTTVGAVTTGTTLTAPTVTFQSFFSGVALDVTPRIDEAGNIILHIHPSISSVTQDERQIDTGASGTFRIPVPRSSVQETDSIVRAQDGQIVAIGGLMSQRQNTGRSQVPGAGDVPVLGNLFRQRSESAEKRELVILLKPTIVRSDREWAQSIQESRDRVERLSPNIPGALPPQNK